MKPEALRGGLCQSQQWRLPPAPTRAARQQAGSQQLLGRDAGSGGGARAGGGGGGGAGAGGRRGGGAGAGGGGVGDGQPAGRLPAGVGACASSHGAACALAT